MANFIGFAAVVIGTVKVISTDASVRTVQLGDRVFEGDIISTGLESAVEIKFLDSNVMDLGRCSQAILDQNIFDLPIQIRY